MTSKNEMGRFVWYELMTSDAEAAKAFYTRVVGWTTRAWDGSSEPYSMWLADGRPVGGVVALTEELRARGVPPHWMAHVRVDDVDARVARARELGGTIHLEPLDVPSIGRFAVVGDPSGAALALFKEAGEPMEAGAGDQPGEFSWHELMSTDPEAAWAFYSALLGWEKGEAMDMGGMGTYQLFTLGGKPLGGYMRTPPGLGISAWIYYANVARLSTAAEHIRAGGGRVVHGPMQVPGGDWVLNALDPQGVHFALSSKVA